MAKRTIEIFVFLVALRKIGSMFILGIYSIYLHEHGLSLLQMNLVNATYFATMLLFELPTGAIADVFGRRKAFLLSSLFISLGFISYGFSRGLPGFITSEVLIAIGTAFENGTFKAWLVDRLNHFGHQNEDLNSIFSRAGKIGIGFGAISSIIGAKALTIWMPLPWLIAGTIFFASGIAAYFLMEEEYFTKENHSFWVNLRHSRTAVKEGFVAAIANQNILFLFVLGLVGYVSVQAINMQWPILFKPSLGESNVNIGYLGSAIVLSIAFGTGIASKMKARFKNERSALIWIQVGIGICIILSIVLMQPLLVMPSFFLHEVLRGAHQPIRDSYLQHSIKGKERRATISSFESISNHIGAITGLVLSGLWVNANSIQSTWIISGSFMVLGTIIIARVIRK